MAVRNFDCGLTLNRHKLQPPLNPLKAAIEAVGRQLLLRVSRCQMSDMLNDRGLSGFKIRKTTSHLLKLSLNTVLTSLKALQVFQHEVFGDVSHLYIMPLKRTADLTTLERCGRKR